MAFHPRLRQREPRLEIPALTRAANGEDCTLLVPGVCRKIPEDPTVVWAHSPEEADGKGVHLKSHDCFGCFACGACHDWLDRGRHPKRFELFNKAMKRTLYILWFKGKLKVTK